MKLVKARVTNYKSIDDSGWVDIDAITCLVGKNESGKTAFLHALNKLNPVEGQGGEFDPTTEFPRKRLNRYKREHESKPATAVSAAFELDDDDMAELPGTLEGAIRAREFKVTKSYANRQIWDVGIDETKVIENLLSHAQLPAQTVSSLADCETVRELRERLNDIGDDPPQAGELVEGIDKWSATPGELFIRALRLHLPRFFYFDDYSIMEGRISVPHLKAKSEQDELDDADATFLALLRFVGAELEEFESEANYERLKADLEAASNEISDELFCFWSQNDQLAVEFDISGPDEEALAPLNQGTNLHVRIRNDRHRVTVPFDQRSRGFVWFFSFLAYFSSLEREKADRRAPLILLLDEPGLNLHAKAQEDFLRRGVST
jgi:energy-coupling factor transporter ATP-binding protein EcfA2